MFSNDATVTAFYAHLGSLELSLFHIILTSPSVTHVCQILHTGLETVDLFPSAVKLLLELAVIKQFRCRMQVL